MHARPRGWQSHLVAAKLNKKTTHQGNPRRVVCWSRLKGNQSVFAMLFSERKLHWPERRDACWSLEHLGQQPVLALEQLPWQLHSHKLARSRKLARCRSRYRSNRSSSVFRRASRAVRETSEEHNHCRNLNRKHRLRNRKLALLRNHKLALLHNRKLALLHSRKLALLRNRKLARIHRSCSS